MASKNFKPEKPAKVTGGNANVFTRAINQIRAKGEISDSAKADAWAKTLNERDWEVPASDVPGTPHD